MTVRETIISLESQHWTDWHSIIDETIRQTGCVRARACDVYRMLHPEIRHDGKRRVPMTAPKPAPAAKPGRSLEDFRRTYDKDTIIPEKIRTALLELGNSWEYEMDFIRRAGVSLGDLGNYRPMFEAYFVTVRKENKRVWSGTEEFAAKLREMV